MPDTPIKSAWHRPEGQRVATVSADFVHLEVCGFSRRESWKAAGLQRTQAWCANLVAGTLLRCVKMPHI